MMESSLILFNLTRHWLPKPSVTNKLLFLFYFLLPLYVKNILFIFFFSTFFILLTQPTIFSFSTSFSKIFFLAGWSWWIKWIQQFPASLSQHYTAAHSRLEEHWYHLPHWRYMLCKWIHFTVGPIHCYGWTSSINCAIHGC